jgi:hypothetical protein
MLKLPADTDANILVVPDPKPSAILAIHFEHGLVSHAQHDVHQQSLRPLLHQHPIRKCRSARLLRAWQGAGSGDRGEQAGYGPVTQLQPRRLVVGGMLAARTAG